LRLRYVQQQANVVNGIYAVGGSGLQNCKGLVRFIQGEIRSAKYLLALTLFSLLLFREQRQRLFNQFQSLLCLTVFKISANKC